MKKTFAKDAFSYLVINSPWASKIKLGKNKTISK